MSYSKNLKRTFAAGCSVVTLMAFGVVGASAQQEKGAGSSSPQQQSPGASGTSSGGGAPASESKQGGDAKGQSGGSGRVEGNAKGEAGTKSGAAKQGADSGEKSAQPGRTDDSKADKKADKKGRADAGKEEGGKGQSTTQSQSDTKGKRDEKKTTDKSDKDEKKAQQASPSKNDTSGTKNEQSTTTKNDGSDGKSPASQSTQKSPGTNQGNQQGQAQPKDGATQPGQQPPRQTTDQGGTGSRNVQLDNSQRVQFRQTIIQDRSAPRVNSPNFTVSIGTRVPRDIRLAPLPATLISIVPAYREYRYFVVEDRIVIIEPSTYEIVEIIDDGDRSPGRGTRDQSASIDLNPDQRQIVLRLVRRDAPRANVNIGLALGAEVPQSVELLEFPNNVVSEISELREYRYVVVEDNVVVVNPRNRVIVLLVRG